MPLPSFLFQILRISFQYMSNHHHQANKAPNRIVVKKLEERIKHNESKCNQETDHELRQIFFNINRLIGLSMINFSEDKNPKNTLNVLILVITVTGESPIVLYCPSTN